MADDRLHIFGIRHHGPGSARSLEAALDKLQPAKILIEGPPDANELIRFAGKNDMKPPLAILVYAMQDPAQASFYPFADYSPEWRALLWANLRDISAEFIDLPYGYRFERARATYAEQQADIDPETDQHRDPFGQLAALAGYDDAEAWWNDYVEEAQSAGEHFPVLEQAVAELRLHSDECELTLQREAHMRMQIRKALAETDGAIAVVCGAWHAPALRDSFKATEDQKRVGKAPKVKTEATWTAWSDRHLALVSGYGAGVPFPGWYRFIWQHGHDAAALTANWQSRVGRLLRSEGLQASTAGIIEAVRLANRLAALRGRVSPGLAEMNDASLAVICSGDPLPLRLINERLVIGTAVGEVPDDVPQPPLQSDLSKLLKKHRLSLETSVSELSLDLRTEAGVAKSVLFNRLLLLGIPWAGLNRHSGRGTFREHWKLCWDPAFSIRLNQAIRFGPTIERASYNAALGQIHQSQTIADAASLIESCLFADLPQAAELAISRLESLSVQGNEVAYLIDGVIPLIFILRYGTARPIPENSLRALASSMVREALIRLPYASHNIDEQAAAAMMKRLAELQHALPLFDDESILMQWRNVLHRLLAGALCHPGIRGLAARFLHDDGQLDNEELHKLLAGALSYGTPALDGARWLEGFLAGSADIILVDDTLFGLMDQWLMDLSDETFMEALPLIRRAFAGFGTSQRQRLLHKVRSGSGSQSAHIGYEIDAERGHKHFQQAVPLLELILGLKEHER
ncbi:MAG: DUF5682 family protein [Gammaproteobacteria bacterium]